MLKEGQVLWIYSRYSNSDTVSSEKKHPHLILRFDEEYGTAICVQLDSLAGKLHKAAFIGNSVVKSVDPVETVISQDSFAQIDRTIQLEVYDGLERFRLTEDMLSSEKLEKLISEYDRYREKYEIDENLIIYMDEREIEYFNANT